jgi:hypothetical protein
MYLTSKSVAEVRNAYSFCLPAGCMARDLFGDLNIDGRLILSWRLEKEDTKVLVWLG